MDKMESIAEDVSSLAKVALELIDEDEILKEEMCMDESIGVIIRESVEANFTD